MNWTLPSNECCVRNAKYVWEPQRYCRNDSPKLLLFIDVGMTDLPTTHERGKEIGVFFMTCLFILYPSIDVFSTLQPIVTWSRVRIFLRFRQFAWVYYEFSSAAWVTSLSSDWLSWLLWFNLQHLIEMRTKVICLFFFLFFYLKEIIIIWVLNMNCFSHKFSECPKSWSQRQVGDKYNVTFWFSFSSLYSYFSLTI